MRMVFVNRFYAPDHSATSQQLTDLAVELVTRGVEVRVVTSRLRYDIPWGPASAARDPRRRQRGEGAARRRSGGVRWRGVETTTRPSM